MFYKKTFLFSWVFFALALPICAFGQEHHSDAHAEGSHEFHRNHAALFAGATSNLEHEHTAFTVGAEYEFRFIKMLGIGVSGELLTGEDKEILLGIPVVFHPVGGLKITASPLFAFAQVADPLHTEEKEWENETGFRAGAAYNFHINKFTVGPELNADFFKGGTSLVYGLAFGIGF